MKALRDPIIMFVVGDVDDIGVIAMSWHVSQRLFKMNNCPQFSFGNNFRVSNLFYSMSKELNTHRGMLGWEF
jgi:hypothetical protein